MSCRSNTAWGFKKEMQMAISNTNKTTPRGKTRGIKTPLSNSTYAAIKKLQIAVLPAFTSESDRLGYIKDAPFIEGRLSDGSPIALKLLYSTHPDTGLHDYVVLDRPITALLEEHGYASQRWDLKRVTGGYEYVHIRGACRPHGGRSEDMTTAAGIVWELHNGVARPRGTLVRIRNGNAYDLRIANLECSRNPHSSVTPDGERSSD